MELFCVKGPCERRSFTGPAWSFPRLLSCSQFKLGLCAALSLCSCSGFVVGLTAINRKSRERCDDAVSREFGFCWWRPRPQTRSGPS
ncbi:hypothetical protein PHYPO_G00031230 [Pangasianodon hypophthalmus]|uniref:Uncharacterized protein n=1 Tax=Pangasianodon hypophthalmus TaxID=310915 RepID=A0A5N5MM03_PANHP|nr:hypothetical protein PHYPO_G00031230 [Pangasianodon hypophthalmus]